MSINKKSVRLTKLKRQLLDVVSIPEWAPFDVGEGHYPFTCADIAERTGRPHGNTHRTLTNMVSQGLLVEVDVFRECPAFERRIYSRRQLVAYVKPEDRDQVVKILKDWEGGKEDRFRSSIDAIFSRFHG